MGDWAIYLIAGILTDVFITLYYLCVGRLWQFRASFVSFLATFFQLGVMYYIIKFDGIIGMAVYSFGCAIGCYLTILFLKRKRCTLQ